jgi:hypothetical protein
MANLFTITTATNTVQLRDARQGETSFTAFNASGRPIRARPRLVPQDSAASAWLSMTQEQERHFAIAEAYQYNVRIVVPPDAPPGSYPFRLDMVGVDNPDEQYTEGPTATFHVAEPAPKKSFPWGIAAVAAGGILLIGIVLAIILWPRNVTIPVVRGETIGDASEILTSALLVVAGDVVEEVSDEIGEGFVVGTSPPAGDEVPRRSEVALIVSIARALVEVPDLTGEMVGEAESKLTALGLEVGEMEREPSNTFSRDTILASEPSAGVEVEPGSAVTLLVSGGPATVRHLFSDQGDGLGPNLVESWLGSINALFWRLELTQEPVELVDGRPWNPTTVQEILEANRGALPHYAESMVTDDYGLRVVATFPGAIQLLEELAEIEFLVYE